MTVIPDPILAAVLTIPFVITFLALTTWLIAGWFWLCMMGSARLE